MVTRGFQSLFNHVHEVPPLEFLGPVPPVAVSYEAMIADVHDNDAHDNSGQNLQNAPNRAATLAVPVIRVLNSEVDQSKVCLRALHLMCSDPRLIEFDLFFK